MNKQELLLLESKALGDDDIRKFLPQSKILKYSELARYPKLESLLTHPRDFAFLLYEDSPNSGHWVCISRPDNKTAEFFDSYGGSPDSQQKWTPLPTRKMLGEGKPYLSLLFDRCPLKVVYNSVKYQKDGAGISDCGRHAVNRIGCMLDGMNLKDYYKFMKKEKAESGLDFDGVVTSLVS